ncbi:hypothetical protein ZYGR_0AI07750 [Zygosaccharomyces rouxii]|uniref:Zn(2)-C6 fungal-type domain-containing protein n=1 Tax=Zygosaccharomyces rouxii TaxID=4956 RepID=A0A1Q3ACX3_ZYGRO|nr:hypothetical protein ZYGR_0AI07750 [Zygosaccharomyces rouxii]
MAVYKRRAHKSSAGHEDSEKKVLRSCVRCRKNKTKCDSMETRPDPCTSCVRKGVECQLDYVTPPQRSKEMKSLYENIRFASDRISRLCMVYDNFSKKFEIAAPKKPRKDVDLNQYPTRILKVKDQFFSFNLNSFDGSLCINNFRIKNEYLDKCFKNVREIIWGLVKIYFKWEKIGDRHEEKARTFVSEFTARYLLQKNQLLLLLCILNFYYDIPGLRYLNIFQYVIESYYADAFGNGERQDEDRNFLSRSALSRIIVGNLGDAQFHSELFIKHFTVFLFLNIIFYGPEYFMNCFMDKYIRTLEFLRKKINFDKNWEVKWVNFYIRLLNLVEGVVPPVEGGKCTVDDEEIEFLFSLVRKDREADGRINITLDCFICLIKFDQYLIERRQWPANSQICKRFGYVCERVNADLLGLFGVRRSSEEEMERFTFIELFFTQLLTLNNLLCVNYCDGSLGQFTNNGWFNGFNYEVYEVIPEELMQSEGMDVGVHNGYYWCQSKYDILKKLLKQNKSMSVSEFLLLCVEVSVGRHCLRVDGSSNVLEMVNQELEMFHRSDDMHLKILKSSCRLIWLLYEFVVFWDMLNHVIIYEPFVWNSQLVLENNGLVCQNDDRRSCHYSKGVADMPHGMDVVDVDNEEGTEPKVDETKGTCNADDAEFVGGNGVVGDDVGVKLGEPEESDDVGERLSLNGGINRILQNVDWVRESADEVFEKIHNVLN